MTNIDMTAMNRRQQAFAFAKEGTAESIAATEALLVRLADANEEVKQGALLVLFALQDQHPNMSIFPEPDSEDGNNPDISSIQVTDEKGEKKTKKTNWYTDYFEGTSMGVMLTARIDALSEALKVECDIAKIGKLRDAAGIMGGNVFFTDHILKYRSKDKRWLVAELKRQKQRKSTGRGNVKRALKVLFAMSRIAEELTDVGVEYATYTPAGGDTSELMRTTYPFVVFDKAKRGNENHWTVSQLTTAGSRKNIDAVKAAGGTFTALDESMAKGTNDDDEGDDELPAIDTPDFLMRYLENMVVYGDIGSEDGLRHARGVIQAAQKKTPQGREMRDTINNAYKFLDHLYSKLEDMIEDDTNANQGEPVKVAAAGK